MRTWLAPAKVNLTLMVGRRSASGLHPIRSLIQTVEWFDYLTMVESEEDHLDCGGADLPTGGDNLVWKAVSALERESGLSRPPLRLLLEKHIPVAAGLGGGSADAAAALRAVGRLLNLDHATLERAAGPVGSDVPAALRGGSLWVEGYGERLSPLSPLAGFAVGVATPDFPVLTADVYRMWDKLDGPRGAEFPSSALPPALRGRSSFRNDLQPAAWAVRPELGDLTADLSERWGRPVAMSGSGPSLFAYFLDRSEAAAAAGEVNHMFSSAAGVDLYPGGPAEKTR